MDSHCRCENEKYLDQRCVVLGECQTDSKRLLRERRGADIPAADLRLFGVEVNRRKGDRRSYHEG